MNSSAENRATTLKALVNTQNVVEKLHWQTKLAAFLAFVLLASPRTRVDVGAPLYMIDVLVFLMLISPIAIRRYAWIPAQPFSQIIIVYLAFVILSELRGMLAYGTVLESIYMMGRFFLAISIFLILPRLVSSRFDMSFILKGILVGTLASAITVIMYSIGPLRPLVVGTIYSNEFLNPGWEQLLRAVEIFGAGEAAMRGRSLVGAATLTAGFIATVWPLSFIALRYFKQEFIWGKIALVTTIVAPLGVLSTYGRGAWIMVSVVVALIAVFGMASARRILLMAIVGGVIMGTQFNVDSELFYMERLISATQETMDSPFADVSTTERLFSYVEPFAHLAENPLWAFAGSGRTGNRVSARGVTSGFGGQLFDEGGRATHSAFAMAYYSFGFVAAICQVLLIIQGFIFILGRMRVTRKSDAEEALVWQSLFMCWCTLTLWWASGHGMVGEPRGAMLIFFMYGLLVAFEKLRIIKLGGVTPDHSGNPTR